VAAIEALRATSRNSRFMERSLIILKPDCIEKKLVGRVLARFEEAGFAIVASKMMALSDDMLHEHYAHLTDLEFFPEICAFMSSRPVPIMILEGENAVEQIRGLLGPTDSSKAPQGTIRGDFGTDKMRNIAHASDSPENADKEVRRFFGESEVF
jgi:nucleoside-diphosphate kinase